ncbi:MAG: hypothetical protein QOG33_1761 [Gaiellales bacterium]|nr:hypothetical protein [Gaiellales bacterium]
MSDVTATALPEVETAAEACNDHRSRGPFLTGDDLSAVNLLLAALAIACILAALAGSIT